VTWALQCVLSFTLERLDLAMPFRCVEMPLSECLADIESWGVAMDELLLVESRRRVEDRMCVLEEVGGVPSVVHVLFMGGGCIRIAKQLCVSVPNAVHGWGRGGRGCIALPCNTQWHVGVLLCALAACG
jgi:hypothetical protein